jgi:hypothetical protein
LTSCAFVQINHHSPAVSASCVHSFHIGEVGRWGDREIGKTPSNPPNNLTTLCSG